MSTSGDIVYSLMSYAHQLADTDAYTVAYNCELFASAQLRGDRSMSGRGHALRLSLSRGLFSLLSTILPTKYASNTSPANKPLALAE